jgi:hypothetical protein
LAKCYEITNLGEIKSYLGMCIMHDHSRKCLEIDQSSYLMGILTCFNMADANAHNTLLPTGMEMFLDKFDGSTMTLEIKYYQSLIGSLLYVLIGMCPNISFALSRLVQYTTNLSPQHLC